MDEQHDKSSPQVKNPSRRTVLKAAGVTAGALTANIALQQRVPAQDTSAINRNEYSNLTADDPRLDQAIAIGKKDEMVADLIALLSSDDLKFKYQKSDVQLASANGDLMGLLMRGYILRSKRQCADLVMTIDLNKSKVNYVQCVMGWGQIAWLQIVAWEMDIRTKLEQIPVSYRSQNKKNSTEYFRPHQQRSWIFDHVDPDPINKAEIDTKTDWPPDIQGVKRWNCVGSTSGAWSDTFGAMVYRVTQYSEILNQTPGTQRTVNITYNI